MLSSVERIRLVSLADDSSPTTEPVRVGIMPLAPAAATQRVIAELRRTVMEVELVTAEVLHARPRLPVYVAYLAGMDAATTRRLVAQLVAWATGAEPRPGLLGLVEEGRAAECEELLAAGFDDAAGATISPRELAGRIRAVHRRVYWKRAPREQLRYGDLTLDLHNRVLWLGDKSVPLTSIELGVMRELMKARGRALSRTELLEVAWNEGELEVSERAVDNVILRLRRKLARPEVLETVRGVGFRLAAPSP